jgi:hypothetical protein
MKVFLSNSEGQAIHPESRQRTRILPPPEYGRSMMSRSRAVGRKTGNAKSQTTKQYG